MSNFNLCGSSSVIAEIPNFPIGMRVLAVDDDEGCLAKLEIMLLKCGYYVKTTNNGITALKMLWETKFDLVISDVSMQDMDGFELTKLVKLEMDLPVILVSAYGDTEFVSKGLEHGACDYLIKPLRIEEMRNIWQHVIRKRKRMMEKRMSHNADTTLNKYPENGKDSAASASASTRNADCSGSSNGKRKEKVVDDEETVSDEDKSAQKRSRVVWSMELHLKFVRAVNHLGFDKAVPKKIFDLMEVQGISRANVASHLQKYRLFIKRIDSDPNHRNQYMARFGKDSSNSAQGVTDPRIMSGSSRLSDAALAQYMPSMLRRSNNTNGLSIGEEFNPYGIISSSNTRNTSGPIAYWNPRPLQSAATTTSNIMDLGRCHNGTWSNATQFSNFSSTSLPINRSANRNFSLPANTSSSSQVNLSFNYALSTPLEGLRANTHNQTSLIADNAPQHLNYTVNQRLEDRVGGSLMNTRINYSEGSMNPFPPQYDYAQLETFRDLMNAATNQGQNDAMFKDGGGSSFDYRSFGPCG